MMRGRLLSLSFAVFLSVVGPSLAQGHDAVAARQQIQQTETVRQSFDEAEMLKISQGALGNQLGDYTFLDRSGRTVRLSDYRGKPLVISLIYTHCPAACLTTTRSLTTIKESQAALGADSFGVLTVGFDTENDIPAAMADFAKRMGVDLPGWEFVSADPDTIKKLSKDLGFVFFPAEEGGFNHMTQTTFVDAQGRVYLHVYGEDFDNKTLLQPLKNMIYNVETARPGIDGLSSKVRLFCTVYDTKTGQYKVSYGYFYGIGLGILCSLLISWWLVMEYRRSPKRKHPEA